MIFLFLHIRFRRRNLLKFTTTFLLCTLRSCAHSFAFFWNHDLLYPCCVCWNMKNGTPKKYTSEIKPKNKIHINASTPPPHTLTHIKQTVALTKSWRAKQILWESKTRTATSYGIVSRHEWFYFITINSILRPIFR